MHIVKISYLSSGGIVIELDCAEKLVINSAIAAPYELVKGKMLDPLEYRQLKEESGRYQCLQKALGYLAMGIHSSKEVSQYLIKKGFDHSHVLETVTHLENSGTLNDNEFAAQYCEYRLAKKAVGRRVLENELLRKGIDRKIIRKIIKEGNLSFANEETIYEMAKKKYEKNKDNKNALEKVGSYLYRRGYEYDTVKRVLERIRNEGKISTYD